MISFFLFHFFIMENLKNKQMVKLSEVYPNINENK